MEDRLLLEAYLTNQIILNILFHFRSDIERLSKRQKPLSFLGQVKRNSRSGGSGAPMEIIIQGGVAESTHAFDLASIDLRPDPPIDIEDIISTASGQEISVTVKVIEMSEPEIVNIKNEEAGAPKQDVVVADATGACTVVLWKEKVRFRFICERVFRFLTGAYFFGCSIFDLCECMICDCFRASKLLFETIRIILLNLLSWFPFVPLPLSPLQVGTLQQGESYILTRVRVSTFHGRKQVTMGVNSRAVLLEDIGDVSDKKVEHRAPPTATDLAIFR